MAQLAIAAVASYAAGAAATAASIAATTTYVGLTVAQWGWMAGSLVGGMLFQDQPDGPRLSDTKIGGQTYGNPIWKPWGTIRGAGQVIWSSDLIEHENRQGKGKRGGKTYTYTVDCAIGICEGPIDEVLRIWANGTCIYDVNGTVTTDTSIIAEEGISIYLGDESQTASALMEGYLGAGMVPAYRGLAYVTLEALQLERFGHRLPTFEFEITTNGAGGTTTREVIVQNVPGYVSPGTGQASGFFQFVGDDYIITSGTGDAKFKVYDQTGELVTEVDAGHTAYPSGNFAHVPGGRYVFSASSNVWWAAIDVTASPPTAIGATLNSTLIPTWVQGRDSTSCYYAEFGSGRIGVVQVDTVNVTLEVNEEPAEYQLPAFRFWIDQSRGVCLGFAQVSGAAGRFYRARRNQTYETLNIAGMSATPVYGWLDPATGHYVLLGYSAVSANAGVYVVDSQTLEVLWFLRAYQGTGTQTFTPSHLRASTVYVADDLPSDRPAGAVGNAIYEVDVANFVVRRTFRLWQSDSPAGWTAYARQFRAGPNGSVYSFDSPEDVGGALAGAGYTTTTLSFNQWRSGGGSGGPAQLDEVVTDLLTEAGLTDGTDFDVSALTDSVSGYLRSRPMSARAAIEPLQAAYYFDLPEIDNKLVAIKRGGASEATVLAADIVPIGEGDGAAVEVSRREDLDLPRQLTVTFRDPAANYDPGTQDARREVTSATGKVSIELPIVMSATQARQRAHVNLAQLWMARDTLKLALPTKYARIAPASPITVPLQDGSTRRVFVRQVDIDRSRVEILASLDDAGSYTMPMVGVDREALPPEAPGGGSIVPIVATDALVLDLPLLTDADDGAAPVAYWAVNPALDGRWPGASLYRSPDGGVSYAVISQANAEAVRGTADGELAAWAGGNVFDAVNTIDITLRAGTLESRSSAAVLGGANLALLGDEIIQFCTATQLSAMTWRLSTLLRGRRNTEWAVSGHAAGEQFLLLSPTWVSSFSVPLADVGVERLFKPVTASNPIAEAAALAFTSQGLPLRPYSPVHLRAEWSGSDLIISWTRRTRVGGDWMNYIDAPLSEASEAYEIDIWDAAFTTRKRVLTAGTATVTYTAAQITTDFGTAPATVGVRAYQMSASIGRGKPARAVLPGGATVAEAVDGSSSASLPT